MKRLIIAALIIIVVFPFTSFAKQGFGWHFLQQNVEQRRQERLQEKSEEASGDYFRMGRSIFENIGSPRRRRITQIATITGVVDGSIVIIDGIEGATEIRLLGVDAPEIGDCYGQESRDALRSFIIDEDVTVEREETYQRDSYRRLVRYLRLESQDVNAWMLWNGYAFADKDHPHERQNEYEALELRAREDEKGIWSSSCDYNDDVDTVRVLQ